MLLGVGPRAILQTTSDAKPEYHIHMTIAFGSWSVTAGKSPLGRLLGAALPALCTALAPTATHAQEKPLAITNARLITVAGDAQATDEATNLGIINGGVMVVQGGVIRAIGPASSVTIPSDATVLDMGGKTVIPGLVDTHSHIGGVAGADGSATIQPDVRIFDSINAMDSGFRRAVSGGLTTLNIMPGSGHLLSGQTLYAKLRRSTTVDGLFIFPRKADGSLDTTAQPMGGIKMANGTNSLDSPPFSGTRGKSAALVRERFIKAQEYQRKIDQAQGDASKLPPRDLGLEALVECLRGTRIVHHHTHRADDIMTVLRLQREFGFRVVLHHVSEAWKLPREMVEAQRLTEGRFIGNSIILVDAPGGKLETKEISMDNCAVLERAGVANTSIHSDDWINDSRLFLRSGAMAVRSGMTRAGALRALTIHGARQLDLGDRVGTLEAGKDADFVVLSAPDPFSTFTLVEQTFVEGVRVFDRANVTDRLYATGGFGAGHDQQPYLCCAPTQGFTFGGQAWGVGGK